LISVVLDSQSDEDEFVVDNGLLHIGRIHEDHEVNAQISGLLPGAAKTILKTPLREVSYPVKLTVRSPGMLDSLCMEYDPVAETELNPSEVEIRVKVSSIK